jgi:uncharacterized membrane protein YqaE (UPF0057 family)
MLYLFALFLPGVAVLLTGRLITGIALIVAQCTIVGWIPASVIAFAVINDAQRKGQTTRIINAMRRQNKQKK